ncbi:glycosyltransferase [Pseudocnuella soli]|uniref:glycosyltransferase n=1 Tax=Pseudocnuella soli TaxID=2502779 RepID=UPI001047E705|nr:glycosyltransferase [Pseudocnuella soli]
MMNAIQRVSVVVCTYNGAAFIEEQLLSILAQVYPLHEIIVADDASTDGTPAIVARIAADNGVISLHQNKTNLGYNRNFEQALRLASGDVIAIADQDDVWHPEKISTMLAQWSPECPLIYCNSALFTGNDPTTAQPDNMMRRFAGTDPRRLAVYNTVSGHAVLFRKELLALALPFHPQVYYDWWLAMVAACNGGVQYCPQVLVYQRWHGANATEKIQLSPAERYRQEKEMVLRNLEQFCTTPGMKRQQKAFFNQLHTLWQDGLNGANRWQLFLFLMQHRHAIYFSKVRKAAFISHLKRSFRYAFR